MRRCRFAQEGDRNTRQLARGGRKIEFSRGTRCIRIFGTTERCAIVRISHCKRGEEKESKDGGRGGGGREGKIGSCREHMKEAVDSDSIEDVHVHV